MGYWSSYEILIRGVSVPLMFDNDNVRDFNWIGEWEG